MNGKVKQIALSLTLAFALAAGGCGAAKSGTAVNSDTSTNGNSAETKADLKIGDRAADSTIYHALTK